MQRIWARKSIAVLEAEAEEPEVQALTTHNGVPLKRTLSAVNLVALGIGAIIGAGIFVLTGHAAAANAGPAITLSFILGAFACAFAGLCYAEMASTVPIAGSAYTYAYATMGELIAWIIGWDLILEYALGAVTVAIGWSGDAGQLFEEHRHRRAARIRRVAVLRRRRRAHVACDRRIDQCPGDARNRRSFGPPGRRRP